MTNPVIAIVNRAASTREVSNRSRIPTRYLLFASGRSALPYKLEPPEDYSAALCFEPTQHSHIPEAVSSIDRIDWKDANNELDC